MSNFLVNLARRGAGLPAGQIHARPSLRNPEAQFEVHEHDPIAEISEPAGFETIAQPTLETTGARRSQAAPVSPAVVTPSPGRLVLQRSSEATKYIANPSRSTRSVSPAPLVVDRDLAGEGKVISPGPARESGSLIVERPAVSPPAAVQLPSESVAATPRVTAKEDLPMIASPDSPEPSPVTVSDAGNAVQIIPFAGTHEPAPAVERGRDELSAVTVTPRLPSTENRAFPKLPNVAAAASAEVASIPIHVRIAKVEVRAAPPTVPPTARRVGPAPVGFGSYYRLRTYRS